MPTTKEELENFIKEYIRDNLSVGITCNHEGNGLMDIKVKLFLGDEQIYSDNDTFYV